MKNLRQRGVILLGLWLFCVSAFVPGITTVSVVRAPAADCLAPILSAADAAFIPRLRAQRLAELPVLRYNRKLNPNAISNQMNMLVQLAGDHRTLFELFNIKLRAIRAEMKNISEREDRTLSEKQEQMVREIQLFYSPLAERLGLSIMAESMNEACFKLSAYDSWQTIFDGFTNVFGISYRHTDRLLEKYSHNIATALSAAGIKARVTFRQKKLYSIYEKLNRKGKKRASLYDLKDIFGIRIIVDEFPENERDFVLDIIEAIETALPVELLGEQLDRRTIRDYGYNGWHIGFESLVGMPAMEVQLMRLSDMRSYFDGVPRDGAGISAHWAYKVWKKSGEHEMFPYVPGLETVGKHYPAAFAALKQAADAAGAFVFMRHAADGVLEPIQLPSGSTTADAAVRAGWMSERFAGLSVANWEHPEKLRFVQNGDEIRTGEILIGVYESETRLSDEEFEGIINSAVDPVTRFYAYKQIDGRRGALDKEETEALLSFGMGILRRNQIYISEDNLKKLEYLSFSLGFFGVQELACAIAVEDVYGRHDLLRALVRELCIDGMNILVTRYSINPINNSIDSLLPYFPANLSRNVRLDSHKDAFFFALALGRANTDYLDYVFNQVRSPVSVIKEAERGVFLSLAA